MRERAQHPRLPARRELPDRIADDGRVADVARAARAGADLLLRREEALALLLDEHASEQRSEQPHVPAQRAVGPFLSDGFRHGRIFATTVSRRSRNHERDPLLERHERHSGPRFMLSLSQPLSPERRAVPT